MWSGQYICNVRFKGKAIFSPEVPCEAAKLAGIHDTGTPPIL